MDGDRPGRRIGQHSAIHLLILRFDERVLALVQKWDLGPASSQPEWSC
jgi:hypothetical protein